MRSHFVFPAPFITTTLQYDKLSKVTLALILSVKINLYLNTGTPAVFLINKLSSEQIRKIACRV